MCAVIQMLTSNSGRQDHLLILHLIHAKLELKIEGKLKTPSTF